MKVFKYKCIFCGSKIKGYGLSPYPLSKSGFSCSLCHIKKVIPARRDILKK